MIIDGTINVGHIITIFVVVCSIAVAWGAIRNSIAQMKDDLGGVKEEMKKITDIMSRLAVYDERFKTLDQRMNMQGERLDKSHAIVERIEGQRFDLLYDQLNSLVVVLKDRR